MTLLSLRPCLHLCCFILKQSWDKSPLSLYFIYTLYLDGRQESKAFRCCLHSDESQHSRRTIHQCLIGISKFSQIKQIILLQNPNTHHTVPLLPHSISYHCMSISSNQKLCPNLILVIASLFTSISSAGAISCSSNIYSNLSMSLDFLYNSSHCHLSPILCLQTFFFFLPSNHSIHNPTERGISKCKQIAVFSNFILPVCFHCTSDKIQTPFMT